MVVSAEEGKGRAVERAVQVAVLISDGVAFE